MPQFKSESCNDFIEKINKVPLSSNDDKRMQWIDSIETYVYETRTESESEKVKCNNIIKQYKEWLTFTMLQKKT